MNKSDIKSIKTFLGSQVKGRNSTVDFALATFLAGGHLLLEGVPGTGKTLLAKSLAEIFGGVFRRIQMTSDLLPSDIVGIIRLKPGSSDFEFREGPLFSNVVLADELNRTPPKTQAALLEAMAEGTVTVDGKTYVLPDPFFVVATQNPMEFQGVYPLAESELDRFMLKLDMDFPGFAEELEIYGKYLSGEMAGSGVASNAVSRVQPTSLNRLVSADSIRALRAAVLTVHVEKSVIDYATKLVRETRSFSKTHGGVSVRAGIQMLSCARALALVRERDFVTPQDIKDLAVVALAHRLRFEDPETPSSQKAQMIQEILEKVAVPQ